MNFSFAHPEPEGSLSPEVFCEFCAEVIRMHPHLTPENCMTYRDDECWMKHPFTLFPETVQHSMPEDMKSDS